MSAATAVRGGMVCKSDAGPREVGVAGMAAVAAAPDSVGFRCG